MRVLGRIGTAALPLALAATMLALPGPVAAAPAPSRPPKLQVFDRFDLADATPVSVRRSQRAPAPAPIRLPVAGRSAVTVNDPSARRGANAPLVEITTATGAKVADSTRSVDVQVWTRKSARTVGADGYAVTLGGLPAPTSSRSQPVRVALSYAGLASMGGDLASRLRVVQLPTCAQTTPAKARCTSGTILTAERDTARRTLMVTPTSTATADGEAAPVVLALAAGESSETGDWSATPLSTASAWSVGGSAGAFTWSYPLRAPKVAAETDLGLAIDYNSGEVDGRTVSTNNQPSWVGEGFGLEEAHIERSYRTCAGDGWAKKRDLCWYGDNASVSFGKWSGELVRTTPGANESASTWRLRSDSGATFERMTDGFNGDNNTEYWVMTTPDGTRYYFGQGKPTRRGTAANSAWTVPVFGNNTGEPCKATRRAASFCDQAWRWNLDRVVDANGNTTLYTYAVESNAYERFGNTVDAYHRGGYLTRISYGCGR